jgi:hypothetical protein
MLKSSWASGNIEGNSTVGGLAGSNDGTITHCYTIGAVHGDKSVAGLVGSNSNRIRFSYSTSLVTGNESVAGLTNGGSVYLCFWDTKSSGVSQSTVGKGKTTSQMQSSSTYRGWGHESQWVLDEGKDYPRLIWENTPGELLVNQPRSYGGGTGEPNNPYQIHTAQQFALIAYYLEDFDKHFILTYDINLGTMDPNEIIPMGTNGLPFVGSLAGIGHTISNFTCHEYGQHFIGLFGYIGQNGYIENIHLQNISVSGSSYIGGLAGQNLGVIHQCSVSGAVEGNMGVGGLVGRNEGTITECSTNVQITGIRYVGGLVGFNWNADIQACFTNSEVVGDSSVGGLVGHNRGDISISYSNSNVIGRIEVGGLVGLNSKLPTSSIKNR